MRARLIAGSPQLSQALAEMLATSRQSSGGDRHAMYHVIILLEFGSTSRAAAIPMDRLVEEIEGAVERSVVTLKKVADIPEISVDIKERTVWIGDETVRLTGKEFELFALLMDRVGRVVSRETIVETLWGPGGADHSLNVHVSALRAKLNWPDLIQTIHGVGYRLGEPVKEFESSNS